MSTSASFGLGVAPDRGRRLGPERLGALDQRHQVRAGKREEARSGVERVDELRVPPGGHGCLGRHQADAPVSRHLDGGASKVITPTTGTEIRSWRSGSAAEVAELQATRISFTPCAAR